MINTASYGAKVLDRVMPRLGVTAWWDEINTVTLWMSSTEDCVLGQLFGRRGSAWFGFDQVERFLIKDLHWDFHQRVLPAMRRNGFIEGPWRGCPDYDQLTRFWVTEIVERREIHA